MNVRPEPDSDRPNPLIYSDPFWGDTPTWLAACIIIGFALVFPITVVLIGLAFAR